MVLLFTMAGLHVAVVSGIPDCQIIIWGWQKICFSRCAFWRLILAHLNVIKQS